MTSKHKHIYILITLLILIIHPVNAQSTLSTTQRNVRISTDVFAIAMPVVTLTYMFATSDWQGLKQGTFTALTATSITYLLKYTIHKTRPDGSDRHSFPSMHTATMFANAAFLQQRYGWKIGIPAYTLAMYVGWGRTFAKKHDWWDVLVGAAIGAGSAYIFTRPIAQKADLKIAPYSNGLSHGVSASITF